MSEAAFTSLELRNVIYLLSLVKEMTLGASSLIRKRFSEQATDFEFKCPECGELLQQDDNTKKIKELEKEIKKL